MNRETIQETFKSLEASFAKVKAQQEKIAENRRKYHDAEPHGEEWKRLDREYNSLQVEWDRINKEFKNEYDKFKSDVNNATEATRIRRDSDGRA